MTQKASIFSKRVTIDRLLSKLGIASRGTSQEWVRAGRVQVNGRVIRDPATWGLVAERFCLDRRPTDSRLGETIYPLS